MSGDPAQHLECTTQFRKLLSIERNPPIQAVIDTRIVPRFVEFLGCDDNPALQVFSLSVSRCFFELSICVNFFHVLYSLRLHGL